MGMQAHVAQPKRCRELGGGGVATASLLASFSSLPSHNLFVREVPHPHALNQPSIAIALWKAL